ncbi:MAG: tetrahydromethanopterin S-methyltransferase subunit A [Candidatus Altiarchaeota archaeon]|nr:tetrahydromethanopterin S-methyltransferase subunit A [Candidatus Altiarchaeota archaeon]
MEWPIEPGEYEVCDPKKSIAVVTLADDIEVPRDKIAKFGKVRTENLGLERIIVNTISNPCIRYLVICGEEIKGHRSGASLVALWKNGLDKNRKIIGAPGALPVIQNLPRNFVDRFREQVEVVDLIGETDAKRIEKSINSLKKKDAFKGEGLNFKDYAVKEEHIARELVPTGGNVVFVSQEYGVAVDVDSGLVIESGA